MQLAKMWLAIISIVSSTGMLVNNEVTSKLAITTLSELMSLFKIPVDETIEIIANHIFASCMYFDGFDHFQFIKLLSLSVKNCRFIFNSQIYQQIDDVAMGSPLGPLFANIFMSFHEKSWLCNCPSAFKPLLYRRYVDDCFLLFRSLDHVPLFLNFLNRQHPNISFTSELEKDGKLPFFDVDITCSNGKFIVNPLSRVLSLTSTVSFLSHTNALYSLAYFTEFSTYVLAMKTFISSLKSLGNCLT